jgi:fatty-acyl-CoA synthase
MQTSMPTGPRRPPAWPRRVPHSIPLPQTTLWENLAISAKRYPDKTALLFFGRGFTFGELHDSAMRLAGWLQHDAGVKAGDRVMLMMQNSPQFVIASYAIMRADAVVVPVNPMSQPEEITHYLADPQARVAICSAELAGRIDAACGLLPQGERLRQLLVTRYADCMPDPVAPEEQPPPAWHDWLFADPAPPAQATRWADALARGLEPLAARAGPDDLFALCYTSGTTGRPKGCMHTHRTVMHNTIGISLWGGTNCAAEVTLGVVPMFHITGMLFAIHGPIYTGATNVIMPRWDRDLAGRLISRHRVSHWTNIPTMIIDLLGSPRLDQYDLSSLASIGGGGAAMPQAVAQRLEQQFGLRYVEGYGLTETAAPSHTNPPDAPKRQCLGVPFIGTDARIVEPGTRRELDVGETGEIVIQGPQVFKGYWNRPADTEAAFFELDGKRFFRTGDLGHVDADGYFFLTDRLKRMINASGFKVWPAEVETTLFRHPAVLEACVIAARDPYRGETVKAVIVLRDDAKARGVGAGEIIAWAREHMAAYKVPHIVEFVESLPKSGSGKVMWRQLQERESGSG